MLQGLRVVSLWGVGGRSEELRFLGGWARSRLARPGRVGAAEGLGGLGGGAAAREASKPLPGLCPAAGRGIGASR